MTTMTKAKKTKAPAPKISAGEGYKEIGRGDYNLADIEIGEGILRGAMASHTSDGGKGDIALDFVRHCRPPRVPSRAVCSCCSTSRQGGASTIFLGLYRASFSPNARGAARLLGSYLDNKIKTFSLKVWRARRADLSCFPKKVEEGI